MADYPPRPLPAAEQSPQRTVADYLERCVSGPASAPWWTTVNPIPAKWRATAGISRATALEAGMSDIVSCRKGSTRSRNLRPSPESPLPGSQTLSAPLASGGVSVPTLNVTVTGLRFFFEVTLGRRGATDHLPSVRKPRKLPVVLSPEEVARFFDAAQSSSPGGLKDKAALSVADGAGLRASELVSLKITDIPRVEPEGRLASAR